MDFHVNKLRSEYLDSLCGREQRVGVVGRALVHDVFIDI
jgi:hypothetical protein